ncbi:MAG: hypothetical protein LC799_18030 [Actinobacteria bacterium]|nr:hypothetical protein [Actinomycetota bacterium]
MAGIAAGFIALSCCVGPTVAALLGITSAAVAFDVATDLYDHWGWAFKLAGVIFAGAAVVLVSRRQRACGARPRVWRSIGMIGIAGVVTYSLLYGATTWLGARASTEAAPPQITVEGTSIGQRVRSALAQVRQHYPHFKVDIQALSSQGVAMTVGWHNPDLAPLSDDYSDEIVRRVEDSREATIVLLSAIARSNPSLDRFSAYEDRLFIPIWSRAQVLSADPAELREFDAYTRFLFSARDRAGYAAIFQGSR